MLPFIRRPVSGGGCEQHHTQAAHFIFPQLFTAIKTRTNRSEWGNLTTTIEQEKALWSCVLLLVVFFFFSRLSISMRQNCF